MTTVVPKTTTAQGFISTLGNMTYFSDGAPKDYAKYDGTNVSAFGLAAPTITPTSTGQSFWFPRAHFSLGNPIQDPNGNIEAVTAILVNNGGVESPTKYSELALAGGIGAWGSGNIATGTVESQTLVTVGHTKYLFLHDFNLAIPSTAVIDGIQVTVPKKIQGGVAVDQSVKLVVGGSVVGSDMASATPWSPSAFVTSIYGGPTATWSASLTPAQASTQGTSGFGVAIAADVTSTTNYQLVQANAAVSASAVNTIATFNNPVTAGNTIIVGVTTFNETLVSLSDSRGNSYVLIATEVFGLHTSRVYISAGAIPGSTSVTATVTGVQGNSFTNVQIHEFSGILQPSPVEVTAANSSSPSQQVAPFNSGTVTVTNTTDLLFSYVYGDVGGTSGITSQPAGWTFIESSSLPAGGGFQQFVSAYYVPGSSGAFPASWTRGTLGITAAFKTANAATLTVGGGTPNAPVVTIFYHLPAGFGPGFTGPTEPIWSTSLNGIVNDGGIQWTNYGPVLIWYPQTNYPVPVVILDTNGNLQLAVTATSPVQPWNVATGYTVGQIVSFGGGFWISVLNGTNTGVAPNALYNTFNSGTGVTQPNWAVASNPAVTGAIAPVWNTTIGGTTVDGSYTWTNLGQGSPLASFGHAYVYAFRTVYGHLTTASSFSNNTGAILGPLNGSIESFSYTGGVATFNGSNNFIPGNIHTVEGMTTPAGEMLNEQIFTVLTANPSSSFPLTVLQSSGTVLTVTAINILNSAGGQSVTFSGVADAFFAPLLNGQTFVVAPGATSTSFTVPLISAAHGPSTTTGTVLVNGSWTASTTLTGTVTLTEDSGTAAPLISTIMGQGTALLDGQGFALCNSVATITATSVTANVVTIYASNNFQPGIWVTFEGLTIATYLNGQQLQVVAVEQPVGTQNTWFQVFVVTPDSGQVADTGTATFNAVEIYRTSDGGGTYLFDGAVTNPGAQMVWTFDDFVIDDNLDILLIAPLFHQNDPPPGAPGSSVKNSGTISAYWQGRLWIVVGNFVYFDSGPDCTNGIPEEAWAPGNRFQFAGPVLNLQPTADGVGLLVFLADRVAAILGGPDTISFYATDFLSNFGVSNPNAVFRDGSIIGLFTTQKQYYELLGANKEQIGEHIADYLSANFNPAKSYVAMHRDGTDVGTYISNGVDRILRYGPNVPSWSVPTFPSFGAGAMQSVETSVGIYSLLLATPNGGPNNYIYARDLNSWGDNNTTLGANDGTSYASCFITIGNITLSQPGARLFPLQHVVGYFDAAGTLDNGGPSRPDAWILPNEISDTSGIGFVYLPEIIQEPPIGQNNPSKSLLALRWNVNMMNSALASQFIHHMQIKLAFQPENAPNTIKALALGEDQST